MNKKSNNMNFFFNEYQKWYGSESSEENMIVNILSAVMVVYFFFSLIVKKIIFVLKFNVGFIDSSSMFAEHLVHLYNTVWIILVFVVFFILFLLVRIIYLFSWKQLYFSSFIFKNIIDFFLDYFFLIALHFDDNKSFFSILNRYNLIQSRNIGLNLWYDKDNSSFLTISDISEYRTLEIVWCLLPISSLLFIATPTFSLIFSLDSFVDPAYTVKIIGHQWYWTYAIDADMGYNDLINSDVLPEEISESHNISMENISKYNVNFTNNLINVNFDSVMVSDEDLVKGTHRLLEVDNRLILPVGVPVRLLITSVDVLHSWAVPSLGIKVDAVPGRLNQFIVEIKRPGVFYGQCSELCGPLHGFMPIVIQAVTLDKFEEWLINHSSN